MKLAVIGCGYVGLVSGSCLAEAGHAVIATDSDSAKIAALEDGKIPIYEPHLDKVLGSVVREGRLRFTADAAEAVREAEVVFICVGTPPTESGEADLSAIDNVARMIARESRTPKLVIEKSTVPAQTGEQLKRALTVYAASPGAKFRVASNPEFLREGTAVEDFFHPDRIVIGVEEKESEQQLRELYQPILEGHYRCPVHQPHCPPGAKPDFVVTTIASAELIKHASNSFLGLKISYANVLSDLCERLGGNVEEVTRAVGLDPRIGGQFLKAGLGYGGFCFPKDVQAFIHLSAKVGVDFELLKATERVNKQRIDRFFENYDVLATAGESSAASPIKEVDDESRPRPRREGSRPRRPYRIEERAPDGISSLCGLPALTVPCGFSKDNLPFGVQFIGRARNDHAVIAAARLYQAHTDWERKRPPIS